MNVSMHHSTLGGIIALIVLVIAVLSLFGAVGAPPALLLAALALAYLIG